eukprot:6209663-Pleurochrysis_carterae.AAC.3
MPWSSPKRHAAAIAVSIGLVDSDRPALPACASTSCASRPASTLRSSLRAPPAFAREGGHRIGARRSEASASTSFRSSTSRTYRVSQNKTIELVRHVLCMMRRFRAVSRALRIRCAAQCSAAPAASRAEPTLATREAAGEKRLRRGTGTNIPWRSLFHLSVRVNF